MGVAGTGRPPWQGVFSYRHLRIGDCVQRFHQLPRRPPGEPAARGFFLPAVPPPRTMPRRVPRMSYPLSRSTRGSAMPEPFPGGAPDPYATAPPGAHTAQDGQTAAVGPDVSAGPTAAPPPEPPTTEGEPG